jgi:hypothetical protein
MSDARVRCVVSAMLLGALLLTGCAATGGDGAAGGGQQAGSAPPKFTYTPGPVPAFLPLEQVRQQWARAEATMAPPRVKVKGIYLTAYTAGNAATLTSLVDLVDRTELNAMVVNVKDDWGNITFAADLPLAQAAGAVEPEITDIRAFTGLLRSRHIYSIARVVTFKDAYVPKHRPDLAVASAHGGIWRDYNGVPWLNPYSRGAWEYIVAIARQAALAGFDEIQFDYVRFPTDGDLKTLVYPGKDDRPREQVIADFLAYARKELRPYGVWVSADVFGLVTSTADDMGIGQRLEEVARGVDYVSPMVYPSHYTPGNLGVANPNAMPYETVHRSMLDAAERLGQARLTGQVTMRPWLQDFSMGHPYGPAEVRAQIQATYDAGYTEWLLWNAANVYTEEALQPESQ